jgi:SAM-dependent methyltransferase
MDSIKETVREKYGEIAASVLQGNKGSCCGPDEITSNLYSDAETGEVPEGAINASLGCGNPTALATLNPGEKVLDLGSGGGIDVLLSAKRVGPTGFAYGLDMTDEMLQLAEQNKAKAGAENVKFLKGNIEDIPLPDNEVDVVISNCVINLSTDKGKTLREAFRVLKPGGRFAVSDVVVLGKLPEETRKDMEAYVGCVAGALERDEYETLLRDAGFVDISFEVTREYSFEGACCGSGSGCGSGDGNVVSAFVRATKPA